MKTNRVEAFSDGVFAIAVTLLILEVAIPELSSKELVQGEFLSHLLAIWPKIVSYIVSFAIVGVFWVGHHIMFAYIKKVDRMLLFLNIFLLMVISFIPFPAGLLGSYRHEQAAIILYGATLLLTGLFFYAIWAYATYKKRLVDKDLHHRIIRMGKIVILIAPVVYFIAIVLSFINPAYALAIYALVPILYFLPSPIDELVESV